MSSLVINIGQASQIIYQRVSSLHQDPRDLGSSLDTDQGSSPLVLNHNVLPMIRDHESQEQQDQGVLSTLRDLWGRVNSYVSPGPATTPDQGTVIDLKKRTSVINAMNGLLNRIRSYSFDQFKNSRQYDCAFQKALGLDPGFCDSARDTLLNLTMGSIYPENKVLNQARVSMEGFLTTISDIFPQVLLINKTQIQNLVQPKIRPPTEVKTKLTLIELCQLIELYRVCESYLLGLYHTVYLNPLSPQLRMLELYNQSKRRLITYLMDLNLQMNMVEHGLASYVELLPQYLQIWHLRDYYRQVQLGKTVVLKEYCHAMHSRYIRVGLTALVQGGFPNHMVRFLKDKTKDRLRELGIESGDITEDQLSNLVMDVWGRRPEDLQAIEENKRYYETYVSLKGPSGKPDPIYGCFVDGRPVIIQYPSVQVNRQYSKSVTLTVPVRNILTGVHSSTA